MKLTIEKQDSILKAIKAEYTPAEWIIVEAAMRKYAKSREVGVVDRLIIKQMLSVEPEEESEDTDADSN